MLEAFLTFGDSKAIPILCEARVVERNGLKEGWLDCQIVGNWAEHVSTLGTVMKNGTVEIHVRDKAGEVLANLPGFIKNWRNDLLCITIAGEPRILSPLLMH